MKICALVTFLFSTVRPYLRNIAAGRASTSMVRCASTGFASPSGCCRGESIRRYLMFYKSISHDLSSQCPYRRTIRCQLPGGRKKSRLRNSRYELASTAHEQRRIVEKDRDICSRRSTGESRACGQRRTLSPSTVNPFSSQPSKAGSLRTGGHRTPTSWRVRTLYLCKFVKNVRPATRSPSTNGSRPLPNGRKVGQQGRKAHEAQTTCGIPQPRPMLQPTISPEHQRNGCGFQCWSLATFTGGLTKNQKRKVHCRSRQSICELPNVYSNRLDLDEIMEIGVTGAELRKTRLATGDLLFVEGTNGSIEQIGRVAIWDGSDPDMTHQNHLDARFSRRMACCRHVLLYIS